MKTVSDCSVCLLKLASTAADAARADEPTRLAAVHAALATLAADDFSRVPPAIAGDVLAKVYAALGVADPFAAIKAEHDRQAMAIVDDWAPGFLAQAKSDDDRLERAVRVALVGNGLDLATLPEQADPANFRRWLDAPWALYQGDEFRRALAGARAVLYLCDNAGEVAFDRVLVAELLARGQEVTVSVKGGPALNDATRDDARLVGMDRVEGGGRRARLIDTGLATMGVDPSRAGAEWREAFDRADLVLAKGQANLECLLDAGREVFFLTLIKCSHVARHFSLPKGAAMFFKGGLGDGAAALR